MSINIEGAKKIPCEDATNGRYYLELPDGYRLIFDDGGYGGASDSLAYVAVCSGVSDSPTKTANKVRYLFGENI